MEPTLHSPPRPSLLGGVADNAAFGNRFIRDHKPFREKYSKAQNPVKLSSAQLAEILKAYSAATRAV